MNKIKLLLISIFFLTNSSINAKTNSKIGVDYKIGINYVTHLYTLGDLGYSDNEYKNKYELYLSKDDKEILRRHKDLLLFGQGKVGRLTPYFFFIPAYSDIKSYKEFSSYLKDIKNALDDRTTKPLEKYIPERNKQFLDESLINDLLSIRTEFEEIGQVFLKNIEPYINEVYPHVAEELKIQCDSLNNLIANNDIINKWQHTTKYNWNKGNYIYLLFRAGKHGPSFNNLSENINSCYYKIDEKYIIDMFSHEFGVFLMYDSIMPLTEKYKIKYPDYKNEYTVGRPYWMAYEMLSIFFNIKINNNKTLDYFSFKHSDPIAFMEIFSRLHKNGITNPKDLYCKGIEEYMKPDGYWENGVKERYERITKEASKR